MHVFPNLVTYVDLSKISNSLNAKVNAHSIFIYPIDEYAYQINSLKYKSIPYSRKFSNVNIRFALGLSLICSYLIYSFKIFPIILNIFSYHHLLFLQFSILFLLCQCQ